MDALTEYPDAPDIESSTSDYAARFSGAVGEWFVGVQSLGTKNLLAPLGLQKGFKVLDVGGGHGQNVLLMKQLGGDLTVVGSDKSCSSLIQDSIVGGQVKFAQGALKALPFDTDSFDVVLCYRVMAHINDWPMLLEELSRVSKSLVIVDFAERRSVNALAELFFSLKKKVEKNTRPYRLHRAGNVREHVESIGGKVAGQYGQFFFPMALHRALKSPGLSRFIEFFPRCLGLTRLFGSPVLFAFTPAAIPKA